MAASIHETVSKIIAHFESGDIPEAIAIATFPIPNIPSAKWSLLNRTLMFFAGSQDARGYRQWRKVGRYVKKGSKAFYILVPYISKSVNEETGEEEQYLRGYMCKPVFGVEDTDGDPLDYEHIELPDIPLLERAKGWGISIKTIPGNYSYHGYYSSNHKKIALATPEEKVFFHELAHLAHEKVKGSLKGGQDPSQEIVAELCASALCKIVGKHIDESLGNSYRYIQSYAKQINMTVHAACLKVMSETEKILKLILDGTGGKKVSCCDDVS